jgi:hypothetical protein
MHSIAKDMIEINNFFFIQEIQYYLKGRPTTAAPDTSQPNVLRD